MNALGEPDASEQITAAEIRVPAAILTSVEAKTAQRIYTARRAREAALPEVADLFHDPVWDILLDLFVAAEGGYKVAVTSACVGANVAPSTALRMVGILEERRIVQRSADPLDGRRHFVQLSPTIQDRLRVLLADWGGCGAPVA